MPSKLLNVVCSKMLSTLTTFSFTTLPTFVVVDSVEVVERNHSQDQPHSGGHAAYGIVDKCGGGSQLTEDIQPQQHHQH